MWSNWKLSTENPFLNFGEANGIEGVIDLDKTKMGKFVQKKVIKMEDLEGFSDDLIEAVKLILSR